MHNKIKVTYLLFLSCISLYHEVCFAEIDYNENFYSAVEIGAVITSGACGYLCTSSVSKNDQVILAGTMLSAALGSSIVVGMYNLRKHNELLLALEARYGLVHVYDWHEEPSYWIMQGLCGRYDQDFSQEENACMVVVKNKFERMNNQLSLFDFYQFAQQIPHVDQQGFYAVSKQYFSDYHCKTLGELQSVVASSLKMLEHDFLQLKKLTNLSNSTKLPFTSMAYSSLLADINKGTQTVFNTYLGSFGYSALHNSQRVKTLLIQIIQNYIFLNQLDMLLKTCHDDASSVISDGSQGFLSFTIQHFNQIHGF